MHAHLFSDALAHEAVELLVAVCFASPQPYVAPATAFAGLMRFLHLLATHRWAEHPVVIDLDGTMTTAERQAHAATFQRLRATAGPLTGDAGHAMVLPCTYDATGTVWTAHQPSALQCARLAHFAKGTMEVLLAKALDPAFEPMVRATCRSNPPHTSWAVEGVGVGNRMRTRTLTAALLSGQGRCADSCAMASCAHMAECPGDAQDRLCRSHLAALASQRARSASD